ncbi:prepilin peptidase [Vibrio sp. Isolate33]|uniref:A24 family peptidase n=1 Tax=unclassified Vibrio TaxID=2614977 RepID=UPI00159D990D|nr:MULTISPECIES: prepilin peptidase [unclassified Vibrio]MCG9545042.1 prepilin peptidase [Vibrio sp. Isolate33]NVN81887.1 prepilin peptidase [Vibrio sp. Scap16]QLE92445.1 prepilin peptidase [Vibrio sp. Scap24]
MISESLVFWVLLVVVSVFDVKENRIPNKVLILFILLYFVLSINNGLTWGSLAISLAGSAAFFVSGLILYFLRAMSAGDVKFLGVIGLYVGWGNLVDISFYILIASGIIATFYLFHSRANSESLTVRGYFEEKLMLVSGISPITRKLSTVHSRYSNKVTMPFAPSVVIGLAMYSYFM